MIYITTNYKMITINNRNLCENCFSEITTDPCPFCGFNKIAHRSDPMTLAMGSVLSGRYQVGGVIGKGGFGITYLGYDLRINTRVAIKEYYPVGMAVRVPGATQVSISNKKSELPFKEGAEKFYNEASIVAGFNGNPNIVSVHDFFYENNTVYFIMAYLQGQTLKSYIRNRRITEGQAVKIMLDISNALSAAHSKNILHRDISPDNIMICDDGTVKLLDFGAARQIIANQSQSLSVILKQGFAPLEQYQKKGHQGPWTDIYALGATIYNALTGDVLDDPMTRLGDDTEFLSNKHGISQGLWQILLKATKLNIEDRYQDIFEFRNDISSLNIEKETFSDAEKYLITYENQAYDENATELLSGFSSLNNANETVALSSDIAAPYQAIDNKGVLQRAVQDIEGNNVDEIRKAIDTLQRMDGKEEVRDYIRKGKRKLRQLRENERKKHRIWILSLVALLIVCVVINVFIAKKKNREMSVSNNEVQLSESSKNKTSDSTIVNDPLYEEGISLMEEGNFESAILKFRSLDDSYSEKEELIAAAYYEWANNSEGISAIQRYDLAGDYKDANDLKHELMYQMIQEWGDKALTDEINDYGLELSSINYKNAKSIYDDLKKWKVKSGSVANDKPSEIKIYYTIGGGPYGGGTLKLLIGFSEGASETIDIPSLYISPSGFYQIKEKVTLRNKGTVELKLYDPEGNLIDTMYYEQ